MADEIVSVIDVATGKRILIQREMDAAEMPAKEPVHATAADALAALEAFGNQLTRRLTGPVLDVEPVTWKPKLEAARRYKAGTADAADASKIENEAAEVEGETPLELCDKIIANHIWETEVAPRMTGLHRDIKHKIGAVTEADLAADPFAFDAILAAGKVRALALAAAFGV